MSVSSPASGSAAVPKRASLALCSLLSPSSRPLLPDPGQWIPVSPPTHANPRRRRKCARNRYRYRYRTRLPSPGGTRHGWLLSVAWDSERRASEWLLLPPGPYPTPVFHQSRSRRSSQGKPRRGCAPLSSTRSLAARSSGAQYSFAMPLVKPRYRHSTAHQRPARHGASSAPQRSRLSPPPAMDRNLSLNRGASRGHPRPRPPGMGAATEKFLQPLPHEA